MRHERTRHMTAQNIDSHSNQFMWAQILSAKFNDHEEK